MSDTSRPAGRLLLAQAMKAALYYDGTEAAYNRLFDAGEAFQNFAVLAGNGNTYDETEAEVSARLRRSGQPVTTNEFLEIAAKRFDRSVDSGTLDLNTQQTGLYFLPANGHTFIQRGDGTGQKYEKTRIADRAKALLKELNRHGVYKEDWVVSTGIVPEGKVRETSYTLIQLPRHDREIMVCDEVGNASFVGKGMRGTVFWATYRKEHLGQFPDIARVVNKGDANARIIDLVLTDNPIRPKDAVARMPWKPPLTDDIVLIHMLRHAEANGGYLPRKDSGAVITLAGENWGAIHACYTQKSRSLGQNGIGSQTELARAYGLKTGVTDNVDAIAEALDRLNKTGDHGLQRRTPEEYTTTFSLILNHCLWQAARHDYTLPGPKSGEVQTIPGYNFNKFDIWLRENGFGGLYPLYRATGLMYESVENPIAVRAACDRLAHTGEHGLTLGDQENARWTLDRIVVAGLLHARQYPKQGLPSHESGDVTGYPGQNWSMCQFALRNNPKLWLNGEAWKGIAHVWRCLGLKDGRRDVPERIAEGLANIDRTGHHGLKPVVQPDAPDVFPVPGPAREQAALRVE